MSNARGRATGNKRPVLFVPVVPVYQCKSARCAGSRFLSKLTDCEYRTCWIQMACTSVPACFSQGGRSGLGCVSPAFRPRFACEWNAELTISKQVIGIFRLRFACLQNSPFPRILTAETQGKRGCKNPENRYRLPAFSGSNASP